MAYMIEIKEEKFDKAYGYVEKALKAMGKVMQCFTEWDEESEMMNYREGRGSGNRQGGGSMGQRRGGYGGRYSGGSMGYRDDEEWDDMNEREEEMYGERRGRRRRDSRGRYD